MLEAFIRMTIGPFLIVGGLLTAIMFIGAVAPRAAATRSLKLPWDENYTVVVRHWGFIVGMVGLMLIWAFFDRAVLFPAMLFSAVEKAFMVYLVLSSLKKPWAKGLVPAAVIDGIMVLYSLLYFAVLAGNRSTVL